MKKYMSRAAHLERLLNPASIAVFGGDDAAAVIRQCRAIGFSGALWAVNPNRDELAGLACVNSVDDLPGVPDASFVAAPPAASVEIVRALAARGAPGAVCFAAGFAETGEEGAKLEEQLKDAAGGMAIIGPNCHGFLNYLDGVALWPDTHGGARVPRGVALVLQSGNIGINLTMQQRDLDIAYVITLGNKSNLSLHECIATVLDDPRVTAIGLHIEGVEHVHEFSVAAVAALKRGVPIVAIKAGRSARGAQIALSHTASLAGTDRLYSVFFRRLGIARVETLTEFIEALKFLSVGGVLADATLGSMSCSGGEAALVADDAEALGLAMPALADTSAAALRDVLGERMRLSNPLDYHTYVWGDVERLTRCFEAMLKNGFACTLLVLDYPADPDQTGAWEITERALVAACAASGQRAAIVSSLPENFPAGARRRLKQAGIAPMQGLPECLRAVRAAARVGAAQRRADRIAPLTPSTWKGGAITALGERRSKLELTNFGLRIPDGRVCTASAAAATAKALGYPVVVKALAADIAHKSELGAVALNLQGPQEVREATQAMSHLCDRFLIEKMADAPLAEVIVGIHRDPVFGLTLLLGAGGTLVEVLDDTASLLLPVTRADIEAALASLNIARLLDGYRGGPRGDMAALLDAIEAIVAYAEANHASLVEIDVNPLFVYPVGVLAVDAFIRKTSNAGSIRP